MGLGRLAVRGLTMTDARRITVGPIAAAYLEIQQGVVLVPATDYDALHAEAEALRAENERLSRCLATANGQAERFEREWYLRGDELEAARGLLRESREAYTEAIHWEDQQPVMKKIDAFLTATPAPEAPDHIAEASKMAEQGERQEAACWVPRACLDKLRNGRNNSPTVLTDGPAEFNDTPLYTIPQPSQDVRALAASLYQACGAYDMPERILDALSAAANGEPFAHMIDGLLPCVPPSDQDVRGLVEALEECAASLAWNCFGECRAVHAGPIMPAAMALDTARAALATHRQA